MHNRISITGPESTAKSWLSKELAKHYKSCFVEEYSREYLEKKSTYNKDDILQIAKMQLLNEENIARSCDSVIFCDTDLLVNKIWSTYVFKECDVWIENEFLTHEYGLYLLCFPDIDWEYDPLRENPDNRNILFEMYEMELRNAGFNYKIIKGQGNNRLHNAVKFVDDYFLNINSDNAK